MAPAGMKNTDRLNLSVRKGGSPAYESSSTSIEYWEPERGNTVRLHDGPVTISAKIVDAREHAYAGEIIEFENWEELEFKGLKPGDPVDFKYEHIFECDR